MKNALCLLVFVTVLLISSSTPAKDIPVGVAWVGKSGMANRVFAGLEEGLTGKGIALEVKKELGSTDELAPLMQGWANTKKGVVILRSNGAKWLATNQPSLPTFIGGCNNPKFLGAVPDIDKPGGKITGVSYYINPVYQFSIFTTLLPEMKSVLLLADATNPSSSVDIEGTKAACAEYGIEYSQALVTSVDEAVMAVAMNADKVSAIVMGSQATIFDNTPKFIAKAGKTPLLSYSEKPVGFGALAGFAADDVRLGRMLADTVVEVLVGGAEPGSIPIKLDPEPRFYLNEKTAEAMQLELSAEVLDILTLDD